MADLQKELTERNPERTTWFSLGGITPALSQNAAEACLEAIKLLTKWA
jgi:hypothetical protein